MRVFTPRGKGLGDLISDLNYFDKLSVDSEVVVSDHYFKDGNRRRRRDCTKLYELAPLFSRRFVISGLDGSEPIKPYDVNFPDCPRIWTNVRWVPNRSGLIAYQFDGLSHKVKNFPSVEVEDSILRFIRSNKFGVIRLGSDLSLFEVVQILSKVEAIVTIDSGMGWLAGCVGTPIFYTCNGFSEELFRLYHSNVHYHLNKCVDDLVVSLGKFFDCDDYYVSNCHNSRWFLGKERADA